MPTDKWNRKSLVEDLRRLATHSNVTKQGILSLWKCTYVKGRRWRDRSHKVYSYIFLIILSFSPTIKGARGTKFGIKVLYTMHRLILFQMLNDMPTAHISQFDV